MALDADKLVEAKLKDSASPEVIALWREIWTCYESGGLAAVESELLRRLKSAKSAAAKEMQATKKVVPKKKGKKRRGR